MINDYAIVVGIKDYVGLEGLEGPERDAQEFVDWLAAVNGGNVPKHNIALILSSTSGPGRPAVADVDAAFLKLRSLPHLPDQPAARRLYIYFAGHGIAPDLNPDDAGLLMADATQQTYGYHIPGRLYANSIVLEGMFEEIILLMDCCRDNHGRVPIRALPWATTASSNGGDTRRFYGFATRWGRRTREQRILNGKLDPQGPFRGVFTTVVLEALGGSLVNSAGEVTSTEVVNHVSTRLREMLGKKFKPAQFDVDPEIVFLSKAQKQHARVIITFSGSVSGPVLLFGNGPGAQPVDHTQGPVTLRLPAGVYAIHDSGSSKFKGFQITGTDDQHVTL